MTADTQELVAGLIAQGVRFRLRDGELRADAPKGVLTPELIARLRQAKPEILASARPQTRTLACIGCGEFHFVEPTLCYWCRRRRDGRPLGPPCAGCGEACEQCLGHEHDEGARP
ncbi:MAG: hypothetical protein WD960_03620 [Gemmatimonadota bacterium]